MRLLGEADEAAGVNTQWLSRLVAQRPPNSRRPSTARRPRGSGRRANPSPDPTPGHGEKTARWASRGCGSDAGRLFRTRRRRDLVDRRAERRGGSCDGILPGTSTAVSTSSERASSIIPSKRPRTETPRRAASASTQARRSWSSRIPTTVDLVVAMTGLTVTRSVYNGGRKMVAARLCVSCLPESEAARQAAAARSYWAQWVGEAAIAAQVLPRRRDPLSPPLGGVPGHDPGEGIT